MSSHPRYRPRQSPPFAILARGGQLHGNLAQAQRAALPGLAADVAATLRAMLESGRLVIKAGRVVVPQSEEKPES